MAESNLRMEGSIKKCNLVGFKTRLPQRSPYGRSVETTSYKSSTPFPEDS